MLARAGPVWPKPAPGTDALSWYECCDICNGGVRHCVLNGCDCARA